MSAFCSERVVHTAATITEPERPRQPGERGDSWEDMSLLRTIAILFRDRRIVLVITSIGMVVGLALAVMRKSSYTSNFSFLPQAVQDPSRAGLASLASQFGLGAFGGGAQPSQLYADLIFSREVLTPIVNGSFSVGSNQTKRVPLPEILKIEGATRPIVVDNTLRALRSGIITTSVATKTTGMVTVSVRTPFAPSSLQIAERLLEGLNHFNLVTRQSQASEERRFTEGRLAATRASLRTAENALQFFLQANYVIISPQLVFERDRLQREVTLQQQVVATLAQQFEDARIREVRDTPVITVIDSPILAAKPDPRLRALIFTAATFAGFCLSVLVVLFRNARSLKASWGRDPAMDLLSNEWKRVRGKVASDPPIP